MIMQQAFNEILMNVTQAAESIDMKNSKNCFDTSLCDSTSNTTIASSILKNNFFSNLVANDYLLKNIDNKENYNLNDGATSIESKSSSSASLSSSLSSSSSLSPPASSSPFGNTLSSLSRSSSSCSLLNSSLQQQQHNQQSKSSNSSSPTLSDDVLSSNCVLSSNPSASSTDNMIPFNFPIVMPVSQSPNILQKLPNPDFSFVSPLINNQNSSNGPSQLNLLLNQKQSSNCKPNKPAEVPKHPNITNEQIQQLLSMQMDLNVGYLNSNLIDWSILNNPERCLQNKDDLQWVGKLNKELWWNVNKLVEMILMKNSLRVENQIQSVIAQNQMASNNNNNNTNNNFRTPRKIIGNHAGQIHMPVNNPIISSNNQQHMLNKYYPSQIQTPNQQLNQSIPQQFSQQQPQQQLQKQQQFPQNNYINQQQQQQYQNGRIFGRVITNNRGFAQRIQN